MKIDDTLFEIQRKLWKKHSVNDSERMIAPLAWYIYTGRATAEFERMIVNTNSRQKAAIANRLAKDYMVYPKAIDSICDYIGYTRAEH